MSVNVTALELPRTTSAPRRRGRQLQRRERRRLAEQDRRLSHLAELHRIRAVLAEAVTLVSKGWVQHGWFSTADPSGQQRVVSAHTASAMSGQPVSGACLVGAIVHAGGGPDAVHTQLVQRTLDLTWHTLYEDPHEPVRWCPAPATRMAHVRDLTKWNDKPKRSLTQVTQLLHEAMATAEAQIALLRVS